MAATLVDLADGVTAALNDAQAAAVAFTGGLVWKAERLYLPVYELKDLKELKVSVVPRGRSTARIDRGHRKQDAPMVDVGILKRVPGNEPGKVDSDLVDLLLGLVEEMSDFLLETRVTAGGGSCLAAQVDNDPAWDPVHLEELRQFTSVLSVTYGALRA